MKYNHNANIELKTGRNRSYTTIQRDEDKSRGGHSGQWPASIAYYVMLIQKVNGKFKANDW